MAEVTERDREFYAKHIRRYVQSWVERQYHHTDQEAADEGIEEEVVEALQTYRESCVAEEREACAMLHESVPNECDRDLHRLTVTGCGCGAMGAVIAYRDAIRKRGQRG